jgi:phytoene dehydrogenase-like protein
MTGGAGRVVVVGGGHNGLVAAAYLAKAGHKPLVLERRDVVGGATVTEELAPGFRVSALAHAAGPFLPSVAKDLDLARHGLELLAADPRLVALSPDGRAAAFHTDTQKTAAELARFSEKDAARYPELVGSLGRIAAVLAPLLTSTPPAVDSPSFGDLLGLGKLGNAFRKLPKRDAHRLLRWGPMAIADFASEWFETEVLRAVLASRGIFGTFAGPWSAGTTATFLLSAAGEPHPAGTSSYVKGGLGALTQALANAARAAGAEVRTGADVARILVRDGAAVGVVLASGEEIPARAVVSNADPKRTFLSLLDPIELGPDFLGKARNIRAVGTLAKINLALSAAPRFTGLEALPPGRIHIGASIDDLERAFDAAKYGGFSKEPLLEVVIPTVLDPSLAPAGAHVVSVAMQFAPYKLANGDGWSARREELGDTVVSTLERYAPGLEALVVARQVLTPEDLETKYGLTGGHPFHGEPALDQIYTMRPILGWARYRTPIRGLYLCGAGTHPGGGVTGAPGANAAREIAKDLRGR